MTAFEKAKRFNGDFSENLYGNGDASDKIVSTIINHTN
jgi:hypothetical protein